MSAQPPLDPSALENLHQMSEGDGGAFVRELVETFLHDSPGRLAELSQAMTKADAGTVSRTAHTLKGSSSNFGAVRFAALSLQIEKLAQKGDLAQAVTLVRDLHAEFEVVKKALLAAVPGTK